MKNPDIYFELIDYDGLFEGVDKYGRFKCITGDKKLMKRSKDGDDTNHMVYEVVECYLCGRYLHTVAIKFPTFNMDVAENLGKYYANELEESIRSMIDYITPRWPDTVVVASAPRDIWKHGRAHEFIASDLYEPIFERCGFRLIGDQKTNRGALIPYLTMIYIDSATASAIVDNFLDFF